MFPGFRRKFSLARLLLPFGLLLATLVIILLTRSHRDLRVAYERLFDRAANLHPGLYAAPLRAKTIEGQTVHIGEPTANPFQVVVFFTTRCPYSRASIPAFQSIARSLPPGAVLGVALDSVHLARRYAEEHELGYPVVATLDRRVGGLYWVRRVPLLVVVNDEGRITYTRRGELHTSSAVDSVVRAARGTLDAASPPTTSGRLSSPTYGQSRIAGPASQIEGEGAVTAETAP